MKASSIILLVLILLAALPLGGGLIRGFADGFFSFPPLVEHQPQHAPFSAPVFIIFAVLSFLAALLFLFPHRFGFKRKPVAPVPAKTPFPVWGWLGLALTLASWICAWGQFDFLGIARLHTFFPLWLGFIFTMDGMAFRRTGSSLFSKHRPTFLMLFPVSALSWWYFELLNRFVQNWWYPDRMDFGPAHYIVYSSLCFSTVLPAIVEVYEWLKSFPAMSVRYSCGPRVRLPPRSMVAISAVLLILTPLFPDPLFFATWLAPLGLLGATLSISGIRSPFSSIREGDWTAAINLGLAALICGFFWEMWNFCSTPCWEYSIPYVNRGHLFAMPAVGYSGYLPFGPVCACFWLAWTALLPERIRIRLGGLAFRPEPAPEASP